jgi:hypothetical protein
VAPLSRFINLHSGCDGWWETGDESLEAWLADRLTDTALTAEAEFLVAHPAFELPYGRAWLLLLLRELELRGRGKPGTVVAGLREHTEAAVLGWLSANPCTPHAQHSSWLFAWWLSSLGGSPECRAQLEGLYRDKAVGMREAVHAAPHDPRGFLHLPSLVDVVEGCEVGAGAPLPPPPVLQVRVGVQCAQLHTCTGTTHIPLLCCQSRCRRHGGPGRHRGG